MACPQYFLRQMLVGVELKVGTVIASMDRFPGYRYGSLELQSDLNFLKSRGALVARLPRCHELYGL